MKRVKEPTYTPYITGPIERFDERNTGYSRAARGEVGSPGRGFRERSKKGKKEVPGYGHEDYALSAAARVVDTVLRGTVLSREKGITRFSLNGPPMDIEDTGKMSDKLKGVAKWFGADLAGICELNHQWFYSCWGDHNLNLSNIEGISVGDPLDIPIEYKYAIVMAFEEDYNEVRRAPAVVAAYDLAYSKQAIAAAAVAEFIRQLGYRAIPSGNDMAQSIPLAIDAGLGELGRNGLLIVPEYGPRIRLSKVFTDLPLQPDMPIDMGLQHFCETCKKCAKFCPGRAITDGERTDQPLDISNNSNVLKWPIQATRCVDAFAKTRHGCGVCIRVCPWNKPKGLLHESVRALIGATSIFDYPLLKMDDWMGYGKQDIRDVP